LNKIVENYIRILTYFNNAVRFIYIGDKYSKQINYLWVHRCIVV